MNVEHFARQLDEFQQRASELSMRSAAREAADYAAEMLAELTTGLEELRVAEEELQHQNIALLAAREEAEAQRRRYRTLFELAPDATLLTDLYGVVIEANRAALHLFRASARYLTGKPLIITVQATAQRAFRSTLAQFPAQQETVEVELPMRAVDGTRFTAALRVTAEIGVEGNRPTLLWQVRDVTRQRRAAEGNEERLVLAIEVAELGLWDWDLRTGAVSCSPEHNAMIGLPPEQSEGSYETFLARIHPDDRQRVASDLKRAIDQGSTYAAEFRVVWPDSTIRWLAGRGRVFFDSSVPARMIGVVRDVTARRQSEEERIRQQALLTVQERHAAVLEERNRMAQEIHDTLAQGFTGIFIQLGAAEDALTVDPQAARSHIRRASELARGSLDEARRSVRALRSPRLEQEGLMPALERMAAEITAGTGIRVLTLQEGDADPLPEEVEGHLLRVGQEALTNALRHARPGEISIRINYAPDHILLMVEDDGAGFTPEAVGSGFGLTGMRERLEAMGGRLSVLSQPGQGTIIEAYLPREEEDGENRT